MKIDQAWCCVNCDEIFGGTPACPKCASKNILALSRWRNREEPESETPAIVRRRQLADAVRECDLKRLDAAYVGRKEEVKRG